MSRAPRCKVTIRSQATGKEFAVYQRAVVPSSWQPPSRGTNAFVIAVDGPNGSLLECVVIEVESLE